MLIQYFSGRTSEWRLACHHHPERHAKRVQIRADVHANSCELLRTRKLGCPGKTSTCRNLGLRTWPTDKLSKAKVDDFRRQGTSSLQLYHDVARFDVPVNEVLLVHSS